MSQPEAQIATRDMSTETTAPAMTLPERLVAARTWSRTRPRKTLLEEFEQVYLRNVDVLMGYFARRCGDPHTVADLTSETFVRAMPNSHARSDPRRGSNPAKPSIARTNVSEVRSATVCGSPHRRAK